MGRYIYKKNKIILIEISNESDGLKIFSSPHWSVFRACCCRRSVFMSNAAFYLSKRKKDEKLNASYKYGWLVKKIVWPWLSGSKSYFNHTFKCISLHHVGEFPKLSNGSKRFFVTHFQIHHFLNWCVFCCIFTEKGWKCEGNFLHAQVDLSAFLYYDFEFITS